MNKTKYKVYFTDITNASCSQDFNDMSSALTYTQYLHNNGARFVTMASENMHQVGKRGVDEVKNGMTPDGIEYSWVKRR